MAGRWTQRDITRKEKEQNERRLFDEFIEG